MTRALLRSATESVTSGNGNDSPRTYAHQLINVHSFSRQPATSTSADQRRSGAGEKREGGRRGRRADLVRLGDLLELGLGILLVAGVLVRVPLHGQLPVRLLELVVGGAALHLQHLVVIHTHPAATALRWPSASSEVGRGGRWGWVGGFFVRGDSRESRSLVQTEVRCRVGV
jgi:hypothetical protein